MRWCAGTGCSRAKKMMPAKIQRNHRLACARSTTNDDRDLAGTLSCIGSCLHHLVERYKLLVEQDVFAHAMNQRGDMIEQPLARLVLAPFDLHRYGTGIGTDDSLVEEGRELVNVFGGEDGTSRDLVCESRREQWIGRQCHVIVQVCARIQ